MIPVKVVKEDDIFASEPPEKFRRKIASNLRPDKIFNFRLDLFQLFGRRLPEVKPLVRLFVAQIRGRDQHAVSRIMDRPVMLCDQTFLKKTEQALPNLRMRLFKLVK